MVVIRLSSSVVSIAPVQFILQQYHKLNKKEELQFLLSLVGCAFSESQTDLKFVGDVASLLAEYRYENKANQTTMQQAVKEKLVAIRNEAEEKKQASLCGQALILERLLQCLQSRKPFELPKCVARNKPHQIITTFITEPSTSNTFAVSSDGEPSSKRVRIQPSKKTQTTQRKARDKTESKQKENAEPKQKESAEPKQRPAPKARSKPKAPRKAHLDSDSDYME